MKNRILSRTLLPLALAVYLLGIHDGKIALWSKNDPEPVKIFPYSAATLPEDAQKQLENGIPIRSMRQLQKLYEAYFS